MLVDEHTCCQKLNIPVSGLGLNVGTWGKKDFNSYITWDIE